MAQAVIERLPPQVSLGWIVAREFSHHAAIRQQFAGAVTLLSDPQQCDRTPDLVLERASQQAVAQYAEAVLARGWHLAVISPALADSELEQRLPGVGGKLTPLAGAIAGIDRPAAAKEGGLETRHPSVAQKSGQFGGSYAEQLIDPARYMKRAFSLKAAPAKRRGCFRRMPTWRRPRALGGIGVGMPPGCSRWSIRRPNATPIRCMPKDCSASPL